MYFLSDFAEFKNDESDKKDRQIGRKIRGAALIGGSGALGVQSVRSGLPRLLGARLEQHGTSKKAAANIIKEGYLDPKYGGSEGGVTASMKLPKEFLERSKGYTFISGKNPNHPFWSDRNPLSSLGDVVTRKIQVLGYRGSKASKLTDKDVVGGAKFIGNIISPMRNKAVKELDNLNEENFLKSLDSRWASYYKENPDALQKQLAKEKIWKKQEIRAIDDLKKRAYNDKNRVKGIRKTQKKYNKLFKEFTDDIKKAATETNKHIKAGNLKLDRKIKGEYVLQKNNVYAHKNSLEELLSESAKAGNVKAQRLLKLRKSLAEQIFEQKSTKQVGLVGGWAFKLLKSPFLGAAGVGKTIYIPGTDEFFNDKNRFSYDPDDPFGNPLKLEKAANSKQGGMGGNALKTKEKLRAFGNRFSATKYLLEKEGDGNLLKGAAKLIKANPSRSLAGAAILGVGGLGAYALGKKGVELIKKPQEREVKVKQYVRKGKIVKASKRLNPFFNKLKKQNG
ncbi:hypothetical protein [Scytonema sp. NUACC26]|uniref:hypothetical protein n=1 Tax=Scytonema sp. NUACC26 TaxID=3140176 RepID=UPI0034DC1704